MRQSAVWSLRGLALLLAIYLVAPFIASIPWVGDADWAGIDWTATWSAVGVSCVSASIAACIICFGGVPLGYWLARSSSRTMALLGFVVQLPLALPPLTSGVLLLFLLGNNSWIGKLTHGALTDSFAGIVLAEVFVAAPFLIVAARSSFAAIDPVFEEVAATLGHRAGSRFIQVCLPLAWPSIRAGLVLAWLRAFGEFGATVMVAYHPYSLPVYTYVLFGGQGLPAMMPLLLPTLLIAALCALLAVYARGPARQGSPGTEGADDGLVLAPRAALAAAQVAPRLAFHLEKSLGEFRLAAAWAPTTQRLAILGPSGSGKSLTLRMLAGLERNEAGTVLLGGVDLNGLPPEQRQIAYLPQDYGLFPHMTLAQQLAFPVDADPVSARYWLEHLGLASLKERLPNQLSLGQRQRVGLARALSCHSRLLLFDEPFSALDTPRRRQMQQSLRALQQEVDAVTIIVTHDPDEAALLADEVLIIDQGQVLQTGRVAEVFKQPASMRIAKLLGLRNVGTGVMRPQRMLQIADGLLVQMPASALADGQVLMWHMPARGICLSAQGMYQGELVAIELRHGERYAVIKYGGVLFDAICEQAAVLPGAQRFSIDHDRISTWPLGTFKS